MPTRRSFTKLLATLPFAALVRKPEPLEAPKLDQVPEYRDTWPSSIGMQIVYAGATLGDDGYWYAEYQLERI